MSNPKKKNLRIYFRTRYEKYWKSIPMDYEITVYIHRYLNNDSPMYHTYRHTGHNSFLPNHKKCQQVLLTRKE